MNKHTRSLHLSQYSSRRSYKGLVCISFAKLENKISSYFWEGDSSSAEKETPRALEKK